MNSRAVLEGLPHTDTGAPGHHVGLRVASLRHPDAVERLLGRIRRGGDLPLVACCAEDLETVRRHVAFRSTGKRATDVRTLAEATREQRRTGYSAPVSAEHDRAFPAFLRVLPIVILIITIIWQLGLWGVTATLTSYATDEAAHAAGAGGTTTEMRDDALSSVPSWFRDNMDVSQTALGTVKVTSSMPILTPLFTIDGLDLTSEAPIVAETY